MSDGHLRVLGIAGSLRAASFNRMLLKAAVELAPEGMEIAIFEGLGEIPLYNADVEAQGDPAPVARFKEAIRGSDGLLIATPEYNYSMPGVLKNAIDWASRPSSAALLKKPAALMGTSPGGGGTIRAQMALRQSFVFTETPALLRPEVIVPGAKEKFDAEGRLTDQKTRDQVAKQLKAFAGWILRFREDGR